MKEETYTIIKRLLESGLKYEEIANMKKISMESIKLIDNSKTYEECVSKYYSKKANRKKKTDKKTDYQSVIVTANTYMVDQFNEQKKLLKKLCEQMDTLIKMLK